MNHAETILSFLDRQLMRDDPIDQQDARFIVKRSGMDVAAIRRAIESARVPDVPEIREEFARCSQRFLE